MIYVSAEIQQHACHRFIPHDVPYMLDLQICVPQVMTTDQSSRSYLFVRPAWVLPIVSDLPEEL